MYLLYLFCDRERDRSREANRLHARRFNQESSRLLNTIGPPMARTSKTQKHGCTSKLPLLKALRNVELIRSRTFSMVLSSMRYSSRWRPESSAISTSWVLHTPIPRTVLAGAVNLTMPKGSRNGATQWWSQLLSPACECLPRPPLSGAHVRSLCTVVR